MKISVLIKNCFISFGNSEKKIFNFSLKIFFGGGAQWLTPVTQATQEAEIRRISV
jgi:hypothetical protein